VTAESSVQARAELRARVFLKAVLPLLETVLAHSAEHARAFDGVTAQLCFSVEQCGAPSATLDFQSGRLRVLAQSVANPTVDFRFRDVAALNRFFGGSLSVPRVTGLAHPRLIAKVLRLMLSLQVLKPGPPPPSAAERALRVRLVLTLLSRGLVQLHLGGHAPMVELVSASPERVYQWTVERERIAVWLRMHLGRIQAGSGTYEKRAPFVHFVFPDVDAALKVFGSSEQMSGVRDGSVRTLGSPEYTRKLAYLMQCMDQLLVEG